MEGLIFDKLDKIFFLDLSGLFGSKQAFGEKTSCWLIFVRTGSYIQ